MNSEKSPVEERLRHFFSKSHLLRENRKKFKELFGKEYDKYVLKQLSKLEFAPLEALNEIVFPFLNISKDKSLLSPKIINNLVNYFIERKSSSLTDLNLDFIRKVLDPSISCDINNLQTVFKQWVEVCSAVSQSDKFKQKDSQNRVWVSENGSLLVIDEQKTNNKKNTMLVDSGYRLNTSNFMDGEFLPLKADGILKNIFSFPISFVDGYLNFLTRESPASTPNTLFISEFNEGKKDAPVFYSVLGGSPADIKLFDRGYVLDNHYCYSFLNRNEVSRLFFNGQEDNSPNSKALITKFGNITSPFLNNYKTDASYQLSRLI